MVYTINDAVEMRKAASKSLTSLVNEVAGDKDKAFDSYETRMITDVYTRMLGIQGKIENTDVAREGVKYFDSLRGLSAELPSKPLLTGELLQILGKCASETEAMTLGKYMSRISLDKEKMVPDEKKAYEKAMKATEKQIATAVINGRVEKALQGNGNLRKVA